MLKIEETTKLIVDGKNVYIDDLSDAVKQLIAYYDDWRQRELEARSNFIMVQSAVQTLSQQIAAQMKKEDEEGLEAAESEAATDSAGNGVDEIEDVSTPGPDVNVPQAVN